MYAHESRSLRVFPLQSWGQESHNFTVVGEIYVVLPRLWIIKNQCSHCEASLNRWKNQQAKNNMCTMRWDWQSASSRCYHITRHRLANPCWSTSWGACRAVWVPAAGRLAIKLGWGNYYPPLKCPNEAMTRRRSGKRAYVVINAYNMFRQESQG